MLGKIKYNRGDVVWVPFPFTDMKGRKHRPALVVSSNGYNQAQDDVVLAQISTRVRTPETGEQPIEGWKEAGLDEPSVVRPKLFTVEASLIYRRSGHVLEADLMQIDEALRRLLGI